jgi:hypothetical protein
MVFEGMFTYFFLLNIRLKIIFIKTKNIDLYQEKLYRLTEIQNYLYAIRCAI